MKEARGKTRVYMLEDVIYIKFWEVQINLWVGIIKICRVEPSFAEWPLNPREAVLVRSIHPWVFIEYSPRYLVGIGGVCEASGDLCLGRGTQSEMA